ncbi:MAG: hypothetical protein RLZZ387_3748 [Chloroflexota bacterium]|jgi:hypothetical protein
MPSSKQLRDDFDLDEGRDLDEYLKEVLEPVDLPTAPQVAPKEGAAALPWAIDGALAALRCVATGCVIPLPAG